MIPPIPGQVPAVLNALVQAGVNAFQAATQQTTQVNQIDNSRHAHHLQNILQRYKEVSPFNSAPTLLTSLAQRFRNFFRWLFNLPPPFTLSALQMQFAMHLFRNYDTKIAQNHSRSELPFSFVLESWAHFLKETASENVRIASAPLFTCAGYQRTIERAQQIAHPLWRMTLLLLLRYRITSAIDKLKEGETLYLPGGYLSETAEDSPFKASHMLYEVRKTATAYTFRIFYHSNDILPQIGETACTLTKEQLFDNLSELLDVQTIGDLSANNRGFYSIYMRFRKGIRLLSAAYKNRDLIGPIDWKIFTSLDKITVLLAKMTALLTNKEINNDLIVKIKEFLPTTSSKGRLKLVLENLNIRANQPVIAFTKGIANQSDEKLFEVFLKCVDRRENTTHFAIRKLGMKIALLFDIFEKLEAEIKTNDKWRLWFQDAAINLIAALTKQVGDLPEIADIKLRLQQIVDLLTQLTRSHQIALPPGPEQQTEASKQFSDPFIFAQADIPVTAFAKTRVIPQRLGTPLRISVEMTPTAIITSLLERCEELSSNKRFDELRLNLNDVMGFVDTLDQKKYWDGITADEREAWSGRVTELGRYATQLQFASPYKGPLPQHLYQLLLCVKIGQTIAHLNDSRTHFKKFHLDMTTLYHVLKDPYLDLGAIGADLLTMLVQMTPSLPPVNTIILPKLFRNGPDPASKAVRLTTRLPNEDADLEFYEPHERGLTDEQASDLHADFGDKGLLPKEITNLRQLNLLLMMVSARYRVLNVPGFIDVAKIAFGTFFQNISTLLSSKEKFTFDGTFLFIRYIDRILQNDGKPTAVTFSNFRRNFRKIPLIGPYNVYVHDIDVPSTWSKDDTRRTISSQFPSMYAGTAQAVGNADIATRIVEGVVSDADKADFICENGFYGRSYLKVPNEILNAEGEVERYHYGPRGSKQTERTILDERFCFGSQQFDTSADLQLMQTGPVNRVQHTLGTFVHNAQLLGDPTHGPQWQRVFSLNLFRNNALFTRLIQKPEYGSAVAKSLIAIGKQLQFSGNVEGVLFMLTTIGQTIKVMKKSGLFTHSADSIRIIQLKGLSSLLDYYHTLLQDLGTWYEKVDHDPYFKQYSREIHKAYLLFFAHQLQLALQNVSADLSQEKVLRASLQSILKSYFITQQIPEAKERVNRTHNETIRYMMYRLFPLYPKLLEDPVARNQVLNNIVRGQIKEDLVWTTDSGFPLYRSGPWTIDLEMGLLFNNDVAQCPLPARITSDKLCQELFGIGIHQQIAEHWIGEANGKQGQVFQFLYRDRLHRILLLAEENPIIYRQTGPDPETWSQLHLVSMSYSQEEEEKGLVAKVLDFASHYFSGSIVKNKQIIVELNKQFPAKNTPCALSEFYFWVDETGTAFTIENKRGELLYVGNAEVKNSTAATFKWPCALQRKIGDITVDVLNPWTDPRFAMFLAIDRPSQILATGANSRVSHVKFYRYDLEYAWDPTTQRWSSCHHKGYFLSNKSCNALLRLHETRGTDDHKNPSLFISSFTNFHLLEHPTKPSKLQIAGEEYCREEHAAAPAKLAGHVHKTVEPVRSNSGSVTTGLYTFDIDPAGGLRTKDAEGYFYLAYLFFTQSKYAQAIHYLRKAQDIKPKISANTERIFQWFNHWKAESPRARMVLMHVQILWMEQLKLLQTTQPLMEETRKLLSGIMTTYQQYRTWITEEKIEPQLQLTPRQEVELHYCCLSVQDKVAAQIGNLGNQLGVAETYTPFLQAIGTFIGSFFGSASKPEGEILDFEIDQLRSRLSANLAASSSSIRRPYTDVAIPIFEEMETVITEAAGTQNPHLAAQVAQLRSVFLAPSYQGYTAQLGNELIADMLEACTKQQKSVHQFVPNLNFVTLQAILAKRHGDLQTAVLRMKREIQSIFNIKQTSPGSLQQLQRNLKEDDSTRERFFEEALFAFSDSRWQELIEQGVVTESQIGGLTVRIEQFLVNATHLQQYQHALVLIEELIAKPSDDVVSNQLCTLLNAKRHYDPVSDPHRGIWLLLEYHCKVIARKSQIQNVREMLKRENLFKHEALADGKTILLRNAISKIKADGISLSGVMTHQPLIEMHHPDYQQTTTHAYGDKATRFEFSRQTPTDVMALRAILRNLLNSIVNHGRIDMTKRDALSFHHSYILKFEALLHTQSAQELEQLHRELDLMGECVLLFLKHCRLGNDELDKVCDPEKEHNYATGDDAEIDPIKREATFEMVEWLLGDPTYRQFFATNTHYRLTEAESQQLRRWLAEKVRAKYLPRTNKQAAIHYFTGLGQGDTTPFYSMYVEGSPDALILKAFQKFLSEVIAGPIAQRGGVSFSRSKDHVLVKPNAGNGECDENSEHGTEEEISFFHCLNYMDQTQGGVLEEQIGNLVRDTQNQVARMVQESQTLNPDNPIDYDTTPQAQNFQSEFGFVLRLVTPSDYPKIAAHINENPENLIGFLRSRVFSRIFLKTEKIAGNSSDLVYMFKEFYGSAGTSTISMALPSKIVKDPSLMKQPGVDGAVLYALLKDFEDGDIIEVGDNPTKEIASLLGREKGNALIDLSPAFPGMLAGEIVAALASESDETATFRFVDRNETVQVFDGKVTEPVKENLDVTTVTTIFDKDRARGTNLVMGNHSVGYVTISADTKLHDCFQAVARMRKLGKGQKIKYLIDSGVTKRVGSDRTFAGLFAMMVDNDAIGLKKLILKGEKQTIKSIGRCQIFEQLPLQERKNRAPVWRNVRTFFIHPTQENIRTMGAPRQLEPTAVVLKKMAKSEVDKLSAVRGVEIRDALALLKGKASGETLIPAMYLPAQTYDVVHDQEMQQEVEKELEQEQAMEQELAQELEQVLSKGKNKDIPWYEIKAETIHELITRAQHQHLGLRKLNDRLYRVPFYDDGIIFTENFYHTLHEMGPWGSEEIHAPLPPGQMRHSRFVLIVNNRVTPPKVTTIIGSAKDFDHILEFLDRPERSYDYYIYNMARNDLDGRLAHWKDYSVAVQKQIVRAIVQVKLLNGEIHLLKPTGAAPIVKQEYSTFIDFLREKHAQGLLDPVKLEANLRKLLTRLRPTFAAQYPHSTVAQAFNAWSGLSKS